jgi:hypothetical protein
MCKPPALASQPTLAATYDDPRQLGLTHRPKALGLTITFTLARAEARAVSRPVTVEWPGPGASGRSATRPPTCPRTCSPSSAASPARCAAAARLMAGLPVRPGHLGQRRPLVPVLPAGLAAAFPPQRPRPRRRLARSLTRRRPGGVPRVLLQPGPQLSDPLPGPRQLRAGLPQRGHRPRPAPDAATPPARPGPHTAAALPHRARPGPCAPPAFSARITCHPGAGPATAVPMTTGTPCRRQLSYDRTQTARISPPMASEARS